MLKRLLNGERERPPIDLPLDVAFDLLSNARRRKVIREVETTDAPIDLGYLSEVVAVMETDAPNRGSVPYQARKRTYVSLYQSHLPKLEEWDVIEVNDQSKGVRAAKNAPGLLALMEWAAEAIDA